jgi:hypothetical protein
MNARNILTPAVLMTPGFTAFCRYMILIVPQHILMRPEMKYLRCLLVSMILFLYVDAIGQAKVRRLSTIINHPSINVYAPYISADANALIFVSDNGEDHALTPFYSFREKADWKEPQILPKYINTRLNFLRGYGLSADGNVLFFSTMKSPGVGGFDICMSEWKGAWLNPVNLGAPINSRMHEACPSVTPDGKTLYFMRCEKMDQYEADRCKIFRVDKKSNGVWGEPVELSATINTGNSQTPRIMADAETLIFSSDKMASSKGGMDLYVSRLRNGDWTEPLPLEFVNTEKNDQYVSVTGLGRYLLRDSPGGRKSELVEYLIPDNLRPKGMMKIDGKVTDEGGKAVPAYLSLVDLESGERVYNGRPNGDGSFLIYAKEGSRYELGVDPEYGDYSYFTRQMDLTDEKIPQVEKVHAVLKPLLPGDELILGEVSFQEHSDRIDMTASEGELKRFVRLATGSPGLKFEIQVVFEGYQEDSLQAHPDLTEMRVDTVYWKYIDIDTLGQLFERDTASVKVTYHNDRTAGQVHTIIDYLISRGVDAGKLTGFVSAIPAILPENRKTIVKARISKM